MDIAALKAAAEKIGGREWFVDSKPTNSGLARVDDGTSGMFPITAEWHEARYVALANPASILSMIARLEALEAVATEAAEAIKYLHSKLGFETSVGNGAFTRLRMAISPDMAKVEPTP